MRALIVFGILAFSLLSQAREKKEWTFLVFLNGHNNLDRFTFGDMNEMEKVGSTSKVNVVVQWASLKNGKTKRLYVRKDKDPVKITSPVIEEMDPVDMGDVKNLVAFIKWGVEHYPAKHYFIDIWNHGTGWHPNADSNGIQLNDISLDSTTNHGISTIELGQAMYEAAKIIGHPVDIYGNDACLMAMPEVSTEMRHAVDFFVGSEEVIPGNGWPYDDLLREWNNFVVASPQQVADTLARVYVKSYSDGSQGKKGVTFSVFDLSQIRSSGLLGGMRALSDGILALSAEDKAKVLAAIKKTRNFSTSD